MESGGRVELAQLGTFRSPVRVRLYEFVMRASRPVGRDEAARALGIRRSLAAYHLDELAGSSLLDVSYARLSGRSGPGAGRPAKLYSPTQRELTLSVASRDYRLLALLLAHGAAAAGGAQTAIACPARAAGREIGEAARHSGGESAQLVELLRSRGYDPYEPEPGRLRLRNCPFREIAERQPELVCQLNLALIEGMLQGLGTTGPRAMLAPQAGCCCVAVSLS